MYGHTIQTFCHEEQLIKKQIWLHQFTPWRYFYWYLTHYVFTPIVSWHLMSSTAIQIRVHYAIFQTADLTMIKCLNKV